MISDLIISPPPEKNVYVEKERSSITIPAWKSDDILFLD